MKENLNENEMTNSENLPEVEAKEAETEAEEIQIEESEEAYEAADAAELEKAKNESGEKVMTKKNFLLLVGTMIVGVALGFGLMMLIMNGIAGSEKTFSYMEMDITLTNGFSERFNAGADAVYDSGEVFVSVTRDALDDNKGVNPTIITNSAEYARWIIYENDYKNAKVAGTDKFSSFTVDMDGEDGKDGYRYYFYTYKSEEAYWMIYFVVDNKDISKYDSKIAEWASSVKFD